LTNVKSRERGYGPVCWRKVEAELWLAELGDVIDPEGSMPTRKELQRLLHIKHFAAIHHTLDEFLFVKVQPLAAGPIQRAVLAEV